MPFDELYHKEKNLVSAVVKAQKDFDAKEASLKKLISQFNDHRSRRTKIDTWLTAIESRHEPCLTQLNRRGKNFFLNVRIQVSSRTRTQ